MILTIIDMARNKDATNLGASLRTEQGRYENETPCWLLLDVLNLATLQLLTEAHLRYTAYHISRSSRHNMA